MNDTTAYLVRLDCPLCRDAFEQESELREHLRAEHSRTDLVDFVVRTVEEREERSEYPLD